MANYLVTGGCGFIGSHLVDALYASGHDVRILDNLSTGKLRHKPRGVEFVLGDVADAGIVKTAMQGMDGCFHLAAVASVDKSNSDWLGTHRTNLTGTLAVFEAALKAQPKPPAVVFASSAAVYGDNPHIPLSEDAATRPLSAYGADKLGCELHGAVARHVHGVPNCGLRFFNVYGPRQDPNSPYSGVISIFCNRLNKGRDITLYGDGLQTRDFIYVGDVVTALRASMDNCSGAGDILNVCTGRATTVRDLAKIVGAILGTKPDIRFAQPRKGDIRNSLGDPTKAQRNLGFIASTDLASGLATTLREIGRTPDRSYSHHVPQSHLIGT
jgi:UDP-glucose 4-epimerase